MTESPAYNISVVVAEYSPTQAECINSALKDMGLTVYHRENGNEAFNLVRQKIPALVISDVIMPGMDGYELIEAIRAEEELRHIPIMLVSTRWDLGDILTGLEAGADSCVMKPVNPHCMQSRIRQILENREQLIADRNRPPLKVKHEGREFCIRSGASIILNLLFSSYEPAVKRNPEMEEKEKELRELNSTLMKRVEERKKELRKELNQVALAKDALRKSEERFRDLADQAPAGIFNLTKEGKVVLASAAFNALLGYTPSEDLTGLDIRQHFTDRSGKESLMERLQNRQPEAEFETTLSDRNGNTRTVLVSARNEEGLICGMILDISDRKESEEKLKERNELLIRSRKKAEQSENLKTSFLAHMSNEILNPLNSLVGFSRLMENEGRSPAQLEEYAEQINNSGKHLVHIIDSITDIARVDSGELKIRQSHCHLNTLLLDLYDAYGKNLRDSGKENVDLLLKRESKNPELSFMTEPYRLKKIISILLENAIKYTDQGAVEFGYTIHHTVQPGDEDEIQFFVKDTGKGIPQEKVRFLFDRFRQTGASYIKLSEGAGLGLPLTRAYVELLGGRIWCKSESGKGSEFYFTLPFRQAGNQEVSTRPGEETLKQLDFGKHLKILVAEDEESNYILLKALLKELDATLIWVKNGKEAVRCFLHQKDIDLILMDLRMPVMSGFDAVEEIRKKDKDIPIIVQTAFVREEDRESILNLGCNSFLTKPINRESLYREIRKLSVPE